MAATTKTKKKPNRTQSSVTRSAITGHFVKKSTVKRHPKETVTQTTTRRRARQKP